MYLRLRKADTSVFGETLYLAVSNTKKKKTFQRCSAGWSVEATTLPASMPFSVLPHGHIRWPGWRRCMGLAELESDRKVCCFTGNGMVYIYIWHYVEARYIQFTYRSTFRIPHSKSVFLICELWSQVMLELVSSQTNLHCPEESLTSWPPFASHQVKQWHLEPSIVSFNGIIETMKRAQEWKPGLARWVRLGCLGCFDVEDLQPNFFSVDTSTRESCVDFRWHLHCTLPK